MGASDFRALMPSPSLFRLVGRCAMFRAKTRISMVTACSSSSSMRLHIPGRQRRLALSFRLRRCCLPASRNCRPFPTRSFRDFPPSRPASPGTIAPRLLSCLRIKPTVTGEPARLDTRPVASDYLGGTLTRWNMRHCHAATKTCPFALQSPFHALQW